MSLVPIKGAGGANSVFECCPLIQPAQLKQLQFVLNYLLILIHRED